MTSLNSLCEWYPHIIIIQALNSVCFFLLSLELITGIIIMELKLFLLILNIQSIPIVFI